jgi:class 3 adenylate cyclase
VVSSYLVCPVLVGRDDSVALIEETIDASRSAGVLVLIGGEAGVGKSRLGAHALRLAQERNLARLVGDCSPEATTPYSPFSAALRRYTRNMSRDELAAFFSGRASLTAGLLPEISSEIGLSPAPPSPEELFASFWHVLSRVADRRGAMLLLEDVHWADLDSLRMLHYLARELHDLPVWVGATYRSDELHRRHPLLGLIGELDRERLAVKIQLNPLGREDARGMLCAILDGSTVSDEFLDAVLERTEGNPFFIEELARTLVDQGDLSRSPDGWTKRSLAAMTLPPTVREALLVRIRRLPPEMAEVLTMAACAGDQIDFEVLAYAVGNRDSAALALAEGIDSQLIIERRDSDVASYRFRHALTREALADEIIGPARARVHGALAKALVHVYGDANNDIAGEVADHLQIAGDGQRAAAFSLRAARRASATGALDDAAKRFNAALRLGAYRDEERLSMLLEAAEATYHELDPAAATTFATEARRLARELGDQSAEAVSMITLHQDRYRRGNASESFELLEEALRLVQGRDDRREARILSLLVRLHVLADRPDVAEALSVRAIEVAEKCGNDSALAGIYGSLLLTTETQEASDSTYELAVAAARRAADPLAEEVAASVRGYSCVWRGNFADARQTLKRAIEIARTVRPGRGDYAEAGLAWVSSLAGDYSLAQDIGDRLRNSREVPTRLVALAALTEVAERCGTEADAWILVHEQIEDAERSGQAQRVVPALAARARLTVRRDGVGAALPVFREALDRTINRHGRGSHWMFSPDAAWSMARSESPEMLERWTEDVVALTLRDNHPNNAAAALVCRAALDGANGDVVSARSALDEAVEIFRSIPMPARVIEVQLEQATLSEQVGDHDTAVATARAAHESARLLRAARLTEAAALVVDRVVGDAVLATVVFTDIVSSTERAASLGDVAWKSLLERHNALIRGELSRHGGREINTAGDGFLVTFESPTRAVRFGDAVTTAAPSIGLEVRVGIHSGECRLEGDSLTGIAVHIASRIASAAAASEVIVSSTVRDLVAGSGFTFADRGLAQLKGIQDEWRLFALHG